MLSLRNTSIHDRGGYGWLNRILIIILTNMLNMESEINQLKDPIKSKIGEEGFSNLINNLATQAIVILQRNENRDL